MTDDCDLLGLHSLVEHQEDKTRARPITSTGLFSSSHNAPPGNHQQERTVGLVQYTADPRTRQCSSWALNNHSLQPQQQQVQPQLAVQSISTPTQKVPQHQQHVMLQFEQFDFFNQQLLQPATNLDITGDDDDVRIMASNTKTATRQIIPSPLGTTATNSVASFSNQTYSILDDRAFAPPPPLPTQYNNIVNFHFQDKQYSSQGSGALPSFEKVMHSGKILARISIKSLITRSWKEVFWIIYGSSQLIFFRCMRDYEDWLLNPSMSNEERNHLIKLKIDLEKDLNVNSIRGYQCTDVRPKSYRRRGVLHQFKIDSMTPFGPSLVGAFGSSDRNEVTVLHSLLSEMLKRSVINSSMLKLSFSNKPLNTPRNQSVKSAHSQWSASAPSFALSPSQMKKSRPEAVNTIMTPRLDSRISTLTENF